MRVRRVFAGLLPGEMVNGTGDRRWRSLRHALPNVFSAFPQRVYLETSLGRSGSCRCNVPTEKFLNTKRTSQICRSVRPMTPALRVWESPQASPLHADLQA